MKNVDNVKQVISLKNLNWIPKNLKPEHKTCSTIAHINDISVVTSGTLFMCNKDSTDEGLHYEKYRRFTLSLDPIVKFKLWRGSNNIVPNKTQG